MELASSQGRSDQPKTKPRRTLVSFDSDGRESRLVSERGQQAIDLGTQPLHNLVVAHTEHGTVPARCNRQVCAGASRKQRNNPKDTTTANNHLHARLVSQSAAISSLLNVTAQQRE
jgi:hypothetical protein